MKDLKAILKDENGQGMVEYGLILGIIAVAAVAVLLTLGPKIVSVFKSADKQLDSVPGVTPGT